jgi:hypothetical protein
LAVVAAFKVFRKISQNLSPAGVRPPFVARAMPMDANFRRSDDQAVNQPLAGHEF